MREFSVWAPNANEVSLVIGGKSIPMRRANNPTNPTAEFFTVLADAEFGDRYGFCVDGGAVLPDPRSHAQPDGVHGLSELVDPVFEWTAPQFTPCFDVIYELHVGAFGGDFGGVVKRLGYLRDLGVTAIELMPVQPFSGARNWGYDGVLWHAVAAQYGGPTALKGLVDAAHHHGIAVILDVVFNHFGPEGHSADVFGPYTVSTGTAWGRAVNLTNPEVRRYVLDAARRWLGEFRIDGLRLDTTHSYLDGSILEEFAQLDGFIIAEDLQENPSLPVDAQWNDPVHHCLHVAVSGERNAYYAGYDSLEHLAVPYPSVVYTTTHDQVGNRPRGDRPSMSLSPAQQLVKLAVVAALDAHVMLFMGEEYGAQTPFPFFCDHQDEAVREGTVRGRAEIFAEHGMPEPPLDPLAEGTFDAAVLDFREDPVVAEGYRRILQLRRTHRIGPAKVRIDGATVAIVGDRYGLAANLSDQPVPCPLVDARVLYRTCASTGGPELAPWEAAWVEL